MLQTPIADRTWMPPDWNVIVHRIQQGDEDAERDLRQAVLPGLRMVLERRLGPGKDLEGIAGDVIQIVLGEIRTSRFANAENLVGHIRLVAIGKADQVLTGRPTVQAGTPSVPPEPKADPRLRRVIRELARMTDRDREALTRYYVNHQPASELEAEMNMTETELREVQSRAKRSVAEAERPGRVGATLNRMFSRAAVA